MSLIPDWRRAWAFASVQISLLAILFGTLPPEQQLAILSLFGIPPERFPLFLGLSIIIARVLSQTSKQDAP